MNDTNNEMDRNVFQCVARGCDGCSICEERNNMSEIEKNFEKWFKSTLPTGTSGHDEALRHYGWTGNRHDFSKVAFTAAYIPLMEKIERLEVIRNQMQKELEKLSQVLDMEKAVSKGYREVFFDCLNLSNRSSKLSPNDARFLLTQVLENLKKPAKGLNETSPDTYKKLKKEIETLKDRLKHEVEMVDGAAKDEIKRLETSYDTLSYSFDDLNVQNNYHAFEMTKARKEIDIKSAEFEYAAKILTDVQADKFELRGLNKRLEAANNVLREACEKIIKIRRSDGNGDIYEGSEVYLSRKALKQHDEIMNKGVEV